MHYTGSCYCRAIKYEFDVSPADARTSLCHCHNCKVRATKMLHIATSLRTSLEILRDKLWPHNQNPRLCIQDHGRQPKSPRSRQRFRESAAQGILWYLRKPNFGVWGKDSKLQKYEKKKAECADSEMSRNKLKSSSDM